MARPRIYDSLLARIEANSTFIPFSGCYVYMGPVNGSGHGQISYRLEGDRSGSHPHTIAVHKYAYWILTGKWPALLRHRCNVACCWRPDHLIEGTQQQNVQDQIARGTNINQIRWKKEEKKQKAHMKDLFT